MELKSVTTYWMILLTVAALAAASVGAAEAEKNPPPPAPAAAASGESGEVDISDVQNQYWKAHDKEFEVIQNRQYTKAGRIELTPLFGLYQRVTFQDTHTLGLSAAYHFSDMWGAEVMGYKTYGSDSQVLSSFKTATGTTIDFNPESYYMGASALFTPIYGKFSLFGKKISHFDLYLAPGMGVTKTVALRPTPSMAVGEKFWITPKWNFRIEYRWMRYSDDVSATTGSQAIKNGGAGNFSQTVTNQNLMFGISYLFN